MANNMLSFALYAAYMGINANGKLEVMHSFEGYGEMDTDPHTGKSAFRFKPIECLADKAGRHVSFEEFGHRLIDRDDPFLASVISGIEFQWKGRRHTVYGKSRILATIRALLADTNENEYLLNIDEEIKGV